MIKRIAYICILLLSMSCERGLNLSSHGVLPVVPKPEKALTPAACDNNIVAHRGGSAECGFPDNSLASLKYAMSLKVRACECDIYWTKDNNVIVAHANHEYKVNGLVPWEHTLTEIRRRDSYARGLSTNCYGQRQSYNADARHKVYKSRRICFPCGQARL